MASLVSITLISYLLLFSACTAQPQTHEDNKQEQKEDKYSNTAKKSIKAFKEDNRQRKQGNVPSLILPSVYEEVSVFGEDKITLSAQNAELGTLLHSVSKVSGLNLIIDNEIDSKMPITLSVNDASVEEVLNTLMDISGCYYQLAGNILHVKLFMRKNFNIPYTHSTTSFKTDLGGDVLNSAFNGGSSGGSGGGGGSQGIRGEFALKFDNPDKMNGFYEQFEDSIKSILSPEGSYTLNKFSGILSVYDKRKNIDAIEKITKEIKTQIHQQVLIEARILEVVLNDGHSLGVSWEAVADSILKAGDQLALQQTLSLAGAVAGTMTYTSSNFNAIISALDSSGDVDTLSNPRIKVLSGQSAIISSGKLVPFWEKEVQTNQGTGGSASNTEVTYNRRDVLHGLTMGVTPTIMENGKIMLNVIPITSSIEDVLEHHDEDGNVVASAPILNVKEAGTVIFAKDNDLVLIGGLINNTVKTQEDKIPLLGDIPYLGALFKTEVSKKEKRELVILIRLKVII